MPTFNLDCLNCEGEGTMDQKKPFLYKCEKCGATTYAAHIITKAPPEKK